MAALLLRYREERGRAAGEHEQAELVRVEGSGVLFVELGDEVLYELGVDDGPELEVAGGPDAIHEHLLELSLEVLVFGVIIVVGDDALYLSAILQVIIYLLLRSEQELLDPHRRLEPAHEIHQILLNEQMVEPQAHALP